MEVKNFICVFFSLIVGIYIQTISAQVTNYYALSKVVDFGTESTKCEGGQFVKINNNICYDADANGNYVGNGKLYRELNEESNLHIYSGYCYHGKARYIFSADYSTLTIEINPHYKYYYKKASSPSGVSTCTLVKKPDSNASDSPINVYNNNNPYGNSVYTKGGNGQFQNSNGSTNSRSTTQNAGREFKCAYCNGAGKIEKNDIAPASFGQSRPKQRCNECGKLYDPTTFTHYHVVCGHCGGTGKTKL